ncbi:MAG: O-acetyl-ADP-ribose deacetylase [Anaerolineae bacterium]|nr:O-acetyl-ADP-ribose deacetylase [Anaerolineae bacterium]
MRTQVRDTTLELVLGDITEQETDAIVNAANNSLLGGGGVDGAIHRAAGPQLLETTRKLGGCATGDAKITPGFRLKARYIIHTVGPVYRPNDASVAELLASAYRRSLEVAAETGVRTIAFPAISTGVYGYPLEEASRIALSTAWTFAEQTSEITLIRFVLFGAHTLDVFEHTLSQLISEYRREG